MGIRNLEQIRAKNALDASKKIGTGSEGGKAVAKKVPAQIVQNGFLASLAFAIESVNGDDFIPDPKDGGYYKNKKKDDPYEKCGYANTFVSIMADLRATGNDLGICGGSLKEFLDKLCGKRADELRRVTAEALAYLNYLRRFASEDEPKKSKS